MHIWSDYGDEIVVDKGQKLTKWCPAGKVSQRLSMKERGAKVLKQKKKSKKKSVKDSKGDKKPTKGLYTRESEAQLMLQAMAFNEKVSLHSRVVGRYQILGGHNLYFTTNGSKYWVGRCPRTPLVPTGLSLVPPYGALLVSVRFKPCHSEFKMKM